MSLAARVRELDDEVVELRSQADFLMDVVNDLRVWVEKAGPRLAELGIEAPAIGATSAAAMKSLAERELGCALDHLDDLEDERAESIRHAIRKALDALDAPGGPGEVATWAAFALQRAEEPPQASGELLHHLEHVAYVFSDYLEEEEEEAANGEAPEDGDEDDDR
jgi:hypothetical protein